MSRKLELLDAEDKGWHALCERFAAVQDWTSPGAAGEWSAKDVMAHVACWHAELTQWLEAWRVAGSKPDRIDFEAFNRDFHERCAAMSLHDVQAMSGAARHRLREELAQVAEPIPEGWERAIRTICSDHYDEHIPELDAFLGRA